LFLLTPTLPGDLPAATQLAQPATVVATFPPVALDPNCIPFNRLARRVHVVDVIDAVTIEVDDNGETYRVSYIGAALPENSQDPAVWSAAQEYNRKLVEGQTLLLVQDRTDQDAVTYRPRYVLAGSVFVNLEMIASGYAIAAARPPDLSCQSLFQEAQQRASAAQVGLFAPTPTPTRILILPPTATVAVTGPMKVTALAERGTLWQEPEEWVEIRNDSEDPIQLEGWTIQDNERHIFTFPAFTLGPGQYCRVYTNEYHPNSCGFLYESGSPIWNNDTDCAYLKDPYGELISTFCYGFQ
jgi:endonuclease YncB( thermonuclease family)